MMSILRRKLDMLHQISSSVQHNGPHLVPVYAILAGA